SSSASSPASTARAATSQASPTYPLKPRLSGSDCFTSFYPGRRALPRLSTRTIRCLLRLLSKRHERRRYPLGDNSRFSLVAAMVRSTRLSGAWCRNESTAVTVALQQETSAIPIVFVNIADPVGSGFIASLARPGGNLTGLQLFEASVAGKWLAMLKEIAPQIARAALGINPKTASYYYYFVHAAQAPPPSLAI